MPIIQGNSGPNFSPTGQTYFHRRLFITDKNGVWHAINTNDDMQRILAQMTPEQFEKFKTNYRFAPIYNQTGNPNYTGTLWDLL